MKFVRTLYILIVVFAENREQIFVRCIADLEESELVHLSQKLSLLECLQLMNAVYELTPARVSREVKKRDALNENLSQLTPTSKECLVNLEQWNDEFPKTAKPGRRSTMEMSLRWLGRPDLAKYVRETRRSIKFLDAEDYDIADTLEFPGHRVSRRHSSKNDKHSPAGRKKKKKKKTTKKKKKKRAHQEHSQSSATRNKKVHGVAAAATGHAVAHKARQVKKKETKSQNKGYLEQHRSTCCSILSVLFFLILCLVAAYFLRRRSRSMARGTRFKYNWARNKQDKHTCTDHLEWNDEAVCSCSDIDSECTGKCPICSRNYRAHVVKTHQTASYLNTVCVQKPKDRKERRRQRFSFLQKNFRNKKREKDQENRDRKKTLDKCVAKKHEKLATAFQGECRQCACCKCNIASIEKMLCEKRENEKKGFYKLKLKRKRKKKRNEECRRAEKHIDGCHRDVCK